jgi:hypothetical protein
MSKTRQQLMEMSKEQLVQAYLDLQDEYAHAVSDFNSRTSNIQHYDAVTIASLKAENAELVKAYAALESKHAELVKAYAALEAKN